MSGLVLPTRGNTQNNGSSGSAALAGAAGPGGAAPESDAQDKGKGPAQAGDEAGAVIPGVNGIVPTLQ